MPHQPDRNQSLGGTANRLFATLVAQTLLLRNKCGIKVRKVATSDKTPPQLKCLASFTSLYTKSAQVIPTSFTHITQTQQFQNNRNFYTDITNKGFNQIVRPFNILKPKKILIQIPPCFIFDIIFLEPFFLRPKKY